MEIHQFSAKYHVKEMTENDIDAIYELSITNPMFYEHCPPAISKESIQFDLTAAPSQISLNQKHFLGFYDRDQLIAIMDVLDGYPKENIAYIGLFMMDQKMQGKGIGSRIIKEVIAYLKELGYTSIELAFAKGNPQSEAFWLKQNFTYTGRMVDKEDYIAVCMERKL